VTLYDELDIRREMIRACEAAGSANKFAEANGLNSTHVSAVRRGHQKPSYNLCAVLGFVPVTRYVKRGEAGR
jgi:hypothetical protein